MDADEPSDNPKDIIRLNLAQKTVQSQKKKFLAGDWSAVPTGTTTNKQLAERRLKKSGKAGGCSKFELSSNNHKFPIMEFLELNGAPLNSKAQSMIRVSPTTRNKAWMIEKRHQKSNGSAAVCSACEGCWRAKRQSERHNSPKPSAKNSAESEKESSRRRLERSANGLNNQQAISWKKTKKKSGKAGGCSKFGLSSNNRNFLIMEFLELNGAPLNSKAQSMIRVNPVTRHEWLKSDTKNPFCRKLWDKKKSVTEKRNLKCANVEQPQSILLLDRRHNALLLSSNRGRHPKTFQLLAYQAYRILWIKQLKPFSSCSQNSQYWKKFLSKREAKTILLKDFWLSYVNCDYTNRKQRRKQLFGSDAQPRSVIGSLVKKLNEYINLTELVTLNFRDKRRRYRFMRINNETQGADPNKPFEDFANRTRIFHVQLWPENW